MRQALRAWLLGVVAATSPLVVARCTPRSEPIAPDHWPDASLRDAAPDSSVDAAKDSSSDAEADSPLDAGEDSSRESLFECEISREVGTNDAGESKYVQLKSAIARALDCEEPTDDPPPDPIDAGSAREVVLYARQHDEERLRRESANAEAPRPERERLFHRLFGTRFLSDVSECGPSPGEYDLAKQLKIGRFVPRVSQKVLGSFTRAKATQSLYVIANGECDASHADNWGTVTLAVFEGDAVVARTIATGGSEVGEVLDLDQHGGNEFMLNSYWSGINSHTTDAKLVRIGPEGLVVLKDFGTVHDCTWGIDPQPGLSETLASVRAVLGAASPQYYVERWLRGCGPAEHHALENRDARP